MNRNFFYAIATLVGTIVGVGVFGVPYVVSKSGFLIGVIFLIGLGIVIMLLHLFYGEVVCRTKEKHRLIGYAEKYLGKKGKMLITFSVILGTYGALLAYIIVGGEFLSTIFSGLFGGSPFLYSIIFFIPASLLLFKGLKLIATGEFLMTVFLLLTMGVIFVVSFSKISYQNFTSLDLSQFFLPYGVILFALGGSAAIPEIKEVLKQDGGRYKKVIIIGTLIPIILYVLFSFVVVGVSGELTSKEAISGLVDSSGGVVVGLGAVFGVLAAATSFLVLGLFLKKTLWYDYKINKNLSWTLVCFVPLAAFLLNFRDFIAIMGVLGVVFGGINGVAIVLMYWRAKKLGDKEPEYSLKVPKVFGYVIIGMFVIGIAYQIFYYFK